MKGSRDYYSRKLKLKVKIKETAGCGALCYDNGNLRDSNSLPGNGEN